MDVQQEIHKKKEQLQELVRSRSKANCSSKFSSEIDVRRESEIEDLEDQIKTLEAKL